jgi:NAD(P)-dependent dehydrogenase (short-subunit alcohol dehydrogenase family)
MKELAGKTAFVTGAASGIGLGIATALARAGMKVMLCDIERDALAQSVEGLRRTNADVEGVAADVSLKEELKQTADAVLARYGKVHVVVNNAGVGGGAWTDQGWDWTLGVNLMGVVWGFEIFCPLIERHGEGGQVVSTASIAGLLSNAITIPYNVSKYGVVALSEGLRPALAPRGIGVSVLCPGIIRTNIMESGRNLPARYQRPSADAAEGERAVLSSDTFKKMQERISHGIVPLYVGELVREGIENDWPYIFTDLEFEPLVEMRFAAIKEGFDRIRGREPPR